MAAAGLLLSSAVIESRYERVELPACSNVCDMTCVTGVVLILKRWLPEARPVCEAGQVYACTQRGQWAPGDRWLQDLLCPDAVPDSVENWI